MSTKRITDLFKTRLPIVQAGMVWCSGWKLASAVSNAGGLGLLGAGSMHPDTLREHIVKIKKATTQPFGVNVPLLYPETEKIISLIIEENVPIVFSSAGNPATWTSILKKENRTVVHVVSSSKFAIKAEQAGVDAVVAEGFEAGGHNGREETTTLCLIPAVRKAISIPLLAAGGIGSGAAMVAAEALGAEGFQVGTRFVASLESSAHDNFKKKVISLEEGDTQLMLKKLTPVRLIRNHFMQKMREAEDRGASREDLAAILGKGKARNGMFEGNLLEGELEIGQVASTIREILPAHEIVEMLWKEYKMVKEKLSAEE